MKQSLQLRIGQQLTMTPQLQQAIRLLQLSTLDLQAEIQQALDTNPMLENNEDIETEPNTADATPESKTAEEPEEISAAGQEDIPEELPLDSSWEDFYDSSRPTSATSLLDGQDPYLQASNPVAGLREHLLEQVQLLRLSEVDYAIALVVIDSIDAEGYLRINLYDLWQSLLDQPISASFCEENPTETRTKKEESISLDDVRVVLFQIQHLDPPGVAARDLSECLLLQLDRFPTDTPWCAEAHTLAKHHLDLLAKQDLNQLTQEMDLPKEQLLKVVQLLRSLNPKPGATQENTPAQYIVPDVYVSKRKDLWQVALNPELTPKLRIHSDYQALIRSSDAGTSGYLKGHLQEARWFLNSLRSRNETLLKVANAIVDYQRTFLEHGEIAMKPLVLREIAEMLDMHESTISRVTTQKYMHTPRGIFEFKYFFSSHIAVDGGRGCSATAIRAMIKRMVETENACKPLSDNKIAELLDQQGVLIARRTIAKYRETMSIPSSNERKRLV